ncbi:MAG: GNAT family N-acetyltransferase [Oligoflexia bacterium]|nr:GNAT family N-acetyltransferase [Oligoflexia bacterium]
MGGVLVIVDIHSGKLVGDVTLKDIDGDTKSAHVRIAIAKAELYGKGYARNAMIALLEYSFHELELNRIELEVFSFNERAIRLYKSLGFVEEGRKRQAYRDEHGLLHDVVLMSILACEWPLKIA